MTTRRALLLACALLATTARAQEPMPDNEEEQAMGAAAQQQPPPIEEEAMGAAAQSPTPAPSAFDPYTAAGTQSAADATDDAGLRGRKPPIIMDGGYHLVNAIPAFFGGEMLGQPVCRAQFGGQTCGEYYLSRAKEVCQCDLSPAELPPADEWGYYALPSAFGLDDPATSAKPFEMRNYEIDNPVLARSLVRLYANSPWANVQELRPTQDRATGDLSVTLPFSKFRSTDALCRHFFANLTRDVATAFFNTSYPLTGKVPKGKTRGCVVGSRINDRAARAAGMPWDGKVFTPHEGKMRNLVNIAGFSTETVPGYVGLGRSWLNASESSILVQYPIDPYWSGISQLYSLGTMPGSFPDYRDELREVPEIPGLFFGRMYVRPWAGPNPGPYRVYALSFVLFQTEEGLEEWQEELETGYVPEVGDPVINAALQNTVNILTLQEGEQPIHGQEWPRDALGYDYVENAPFDTSVAAARDRGAEKVEHPDVVRLRLARLAQAGASQAG